MSRRFVRGVRVISGQAVNLDVDTDAADCADLKLGCILDVTDVRRAWTRSRRLIDLLTGISDPSDAVIDPVDEYTINPEAQSSCKALHADLRCPASLQ